MHRAKHIRQRTAPFQLAGCDLYRLYSGLPAYTSTLPPLRFFQKASVVVHVTLADFTLLSALFALPEPTMEILQDVDPVCPGVNSPGCSAGDRSGCQTKSSYSQQHVVRLPIQNQPALCMSHAFEGNAIDLEVRRQSLCGACISRLIDTTALPAVCTCMSLSELLLDGSSTSQPLNQVGSGIVGWCAAASACTDAATPADGTNVTVSPNVRTMASWLHAAIRSRLRGHMAMPRFAPASVNAAASSAIPIRCMALESQLYRMGEFVATNTTSTTDCCHSNAPRGAATSFNFTQNSLMPSCAAGKRVSEKPECC